MEAQEDLKNNNTIQDNYFEVLFENHFSKLISIIVTIVSVIILVGCNLAIIHYEQFGSDKKRTLINKLFSSGKIRLVKVW
jgi:hypothetical protein